VLSSRVSPAESTSCSIGVSFVTTATAVASSTPSITGGDLDSATAGGLSNFIDSLWKISLRDISELKELFNVIPDARRLDRTGAKTTAPAGGFSHGLRGSYSSCIIIMSRSRLTLSLSETFGPVEDPSP